MRAYKLALPVVASMLGVGGSSAALEKRPVAFDGDSSSEWNAGGTCHVSYYNICTAWMWCWTGFANNDRLGLLVDSCDDSSALLQSMHFICTGSPPGYGSNSYTGTIAVHGVDANGCPVGPAVVSQPFLPWGDESFQTVAWGGVQVPNPFAIVVTIRGSDNPASFGTDHPAAGPTGPTACGLCYPTTRPNHSFQFGSFASPICPGLTLNDGTCDAQLLWEVDLAVIDSVEGASWGSIKGLYR